MAVAVARSGGGGGVGGGTTFAGPVVFRPDFAWHDQAYFERRQAFLRSYQLGGGGLGGAAADGGQQLQKKGPSLLAISSTCSALTSAARRSLARARRAVGARLRSARRYRRLVWARLRRHARRAIRRIGLGGGRRRRGGPAAVTGMTARDWFGTPARYYYYW